MGLYYQKVLTKNLAPIVSGLGIGGLMRPIYSGRGHVLMFHRVIPAQNRLRVHNHLSLEISPEHLQMVIDFFRKRNYDFICLNEMPEWLRLNQHNHRKFVVFTFDDGYKDNLLYAYPIFKKNRVPFTIYVTNSFPDGTSNFWWYKLEDIVVRNSRIQHSFSSGRVDLDCSTRVNKESAYSEIRKYIMGFDEKTRDAELKTFFAGYGVDDISKEQYSLSWSEIAELSCDPLVTIGAHTLNHHNLRSLSDNQAYYEVYNSRQHIESMIKKKVDHFSYPIGQYSSREISIVKESGFLTATTTRTANIYYDHLSFLHSLPRITVNVLTTEKVLKLQTDGFFAAILNHFRRIVV